MELLVIEWHESARAMQEDREQEALEEEPLDPAYRCASCHEAPPLDCIEEDDDGSLVHITIQPISEGTQEKEVYCGPVKLVDGACATCKVGPDTAKSRRRWRLCPERTPCIKKESA